MRACEQKQKPMLWFVWRIRQLQRWTALFLSMAGRSCLLRYSWFGENSKLLERRVIKKMPPPNRARMAGGGEGHRVELRNSTRRLLYHRRGRLCQLENHSLLFLIPYLACFDQIVEVVKTVEIVRSRLQAAPTVKSYRYVLSPASCPLPAACSISPCSMPHALCS